MSYFLTEISTFFLLLITEHEDIPVKVNSEPQRNSEPSPCKTMLHESESLLTCPSKQKRQRQNVKLERLMPLKEHEFTRRRPMRRASRKNYFPDTLIVPVSNWFSQPYCIVSSGHISCSNALVKSEHSCSTITLVLYPPGLLFFKTIEIIELILVIF